jgi:hypothetical protein
MAQTLFFAVKEDLLPMLEDVERRGPLDYVRTGDFSSPEYERYARGVDLPDLGKASRESASTSESFLVCVEGAPIYPRHLRGTDGPDRFFIDQLINPDTITFSSGGMWTEDILLYGSVGTASNSETSKLLMKRFRAAIRKHFRTIGAYYVGPGARKLLESGKRLTIAQQSPPQFDLILPRA